MNSIENRYTSIVLQYLVISCLYFREVLLLINNGLSTFFLYISAMLMFLWLFVDFLTVKRGTLRLAVLYFLLISCIVVSTFIVSKKLDDNAIKSIGRILFLLLWFNMTRKGHTTSNALIMYNTVANAFLGLLLFVLSFSSSSYNEIGQLVYTYENPNSTGLSSYLCVVNLVVGAYFCKSKKGRLLSIFSIFFPFFVCIKSVSRSSFLSLFVFFILLLSYRKKDRRFGTYVGINSIYIIGIQLFTIFYPLLWTTVYSLFLQFGRANITILGKPLFSAREQIWTYMYGILFEKPFAIHLGESLDVSSGAHNVFLSIWWDYGLFSAILFSIAVYNLLKRMNKRCVSAEGRVIIFAMISAFFHMGFEVLLFSGGINYMFRAFFLGTFLSVRTNIHDMTPETLL